MFKKLFVYYFYRIKYFEGLFEGLTGLFWTSLGCDNFAAYL